MGPGPRSDLTISNLGGGVWGVRFDAGGVHGHLPDADTARWVRDLYELDVRANDPRWDEVGGKQMLGFRDCIHNRLPGSHCAGTVEYREPMTPAGQRAPLCVKHFADRLASRGARGSPDGPLGT